jgi:hypothetical protein
MTRVKFSAVRGQPSLSGFVTYTRDEYSLDFLADSPADVGDRVGTGGVATRPDQRLADLARDSVRPVVVRMGL